MDDTANDDMTARPLPRFEEWQSYSAEDWLLFSLQCAIGEVDQDPDYVAAHVWLNIAAMNGSEEARIRRAELACEMNREDIARAQRIARAIIEQQEMGH